MTKHFTRNTVSAEFYCGKCGKMTQHRIDGVKKGPCLDCIERLEKEHDSRVPVTEKEKQGDLF
jgi:hypothetical protein